MNPIMSPMSMRRPPSTPDMPDRPMSVERPMSVGPMSVENPATPRTPSYMMENHVGGGGNPNNPCNPIPAPPTIRYFKLGLRGGSPMWNFARGAKRVPTPPSSSSSDKGKAENVAQPSRVVKKESHLSKVSILKKRHTSGKMGSLVSSDYNDMDDSSSTPPHTPSPIASTSQKKAMEHIIESKEEHQIVVMETAPDEIMDYDDDNSTVLSNEVSLNSAAQNDGDDVMETLSQSDLTDVMSSPLDSAQISDEYLLFHGNVVDLGEEQYSDKEGMEEYEEVVIRSPTTSDDEYLMQEKNKGYNMQTISISEAPDSPEGEEVSVDPQSEHEESETHYDDPSVMIEQPIKISEEQISTKEDFEELIDEGSRKQNLLKSSIINVTDINDFHKYTSQAYNIQHQKSIQVIQKPQPRGQLKQAPQQLSILTSPMIHNVTSVASADGKLTTTLQNRTNVLTLPKLTTVQPVITFVSAGSSQMSSIIPAGFSVPVISASAVRQLANVKVIDKPSSSLSLTHDKSLPKKIFEDDSVSPDSSSNYEDDKKDSSDEKSKMDSPPVEQTRRPSFSRVEDKLKCDQNMKILTFEHRPSPTSSPQRQVLEQRKSPNQENQNDVKESSPKTLENVFISEASKNTPSPIISKALSSPVIIHNTPELKMTAQVIQESQPGRPGNDSFEMNTAEDKSVVISIPSPTPSQEQMLDNLTLQAMEKRRRDGKSAIPSEFESFEDVLDMIENYTGEAPSVLDDIKEKKELEVENKAETSKHEVVKKEVKSISVMNTKQTMPQLSPLSQPTELTTNMANASQQLRNLLSIHTTTSTSNTESIVKSEGQKITSSVIRSASPVVSSKIIQHIGQPTSTTLSTVIVPNLKPSMNTIKTTNIHLPKVFNLVSNSQTHNVVTSGIQTPRTISSFHFIPDYSKLAPVSAMSSGHNSCSAPPTSSIYKTSVITSAPTPMEVKKPSLSLNAMLQSHPAASPTTSASAENITAASLLATPLSLSKTNFNTSLVQAQPNALLAQVTGNAMNSNPPTSRITLNLSTAAPPLVPTVRTTSNTSFLHTQLTKVLKKPDIPKSEPMEIEEVKQEIKEEVEVKQEVLMATRPSNLPLHTTGNALNSSGRNEDSQNVLLKKLLQNTACASTQSMSMCTSPTVVSTSSEVTKPTPTLSSLLPNRNEPSMTPPTTKPWTQKPTLMTRETSFVSNPMVHQIPTSSVVTSQPLHIDIKKCLPPSRTPSRDDLLSPQTPRSSGSQDSSLQTPPLVMKKEIGQMIPQSPASLGHEVKRELIDENSQHSEISDHSRSDVTVKEEVESMDISEKIMIDPKEELKKQKRRLYQQKRRHNQMQNKESSSAPPKKRPRKSSKVDEDYDTYLDGVLAQLRTLPPLSVKEPVFHRNYGVVPIFGCGDFSKLGTKEFDSTCGDLQNIYGNAFLPGCLDYYEIQPFGDLEPLPDVLDPSLYRDFYEQEFPPVFFISDESLRYDLFSKEDLPEIIEYSSEVEEEFDIRKPKPEPTGLKLKFLRMKRRRRKRSRKKKWNSLRVKPIKPKKVGAKRTTDLWLDEPPDTVSLFLNILGIM